MTVISQTIKIDQIEKETRWDVPFNIELKNLYDQNTRVICIDDIQEHITNGATPLGAQFLDDGVNFYSRWTNQRSIYGTLFSLSTG